MTFELPQEASVLVTGGAGFIGGCVVRRLLNETSARVFTLDKMGYASDCSSFEDLKGIDRHRLLRVDLTDFECTKRAVQEANPDLVMHLAAESHVDRSIDGPKAFLESNVVGTFNLLESLKSHLDVLPEPRQKHFRMHHISTDEVFGSLGSQGKFAENTSYDPRSPYSSTKAASDHLVRAWFHTYGLPVVITNCSNNYGPWQFPEKLIPVVILKAITGANIPLYGNGLNIRDWLFVEDHVDALLLAATKGQPGESYCIGGFGERTNKDVVSNICALLDEFHPEGSPHARLITYVEDRPGHDLRYSIDASKISSELGWQPKHDFDRGLRLTVRWYLDNLDWCRKVSLKSGYSGQRIGNYLK